MAAAQGDREAYSVLITRNYDRVFRLAFRLTGHRAETEDLTQDVFAALPGKLRGWRGEARFTTWLYRVVVNASHDRRRRNVSHARAAQGWGDFELARQADNSTRAEALSWLENAMMHLPQDLRDTVVLVVTEDMTHAETSEILGVSEGTISWRMSEIRKRLRACAEHEETP
ncbi:RNA polymerase sigma factor, sigma-70 family [Puniceibacterium sp. IMCC21224]|nr:RNA polymerase sigma factor, sigma-70 family [Puniceibacterium sp. IMCC21224]